MPEPRSDRDKDRPIRILVIAADPALRSEIGRILSGDGHQVTAVAGGEEALVRFRHEPFPLVLAEIATEEIEGVIPFEEIRKSDPETLVVVMADQAGIGRATEAVRAGAYDYLIKPFEDIDVISSLIRRAGAQIRLQEQNRIQAELLRRNTEELEHLNEVLTGMAIRDSLTGLFNRRHFQVALDKEIERSRRHARFFSVIFMDVDFFKRYNDTHGHLSGDRVLTKLGEIVSSCSRASASVARYGGEEFVALLPETSKDGALVYAERVREAVEAQRFEGGETQPEGRVTLSLGVATFPEDAENAQELLEIADRGLDEAKASGRNAVRTVGKQRPVSAGFGFD